MPNRLILEVGSGQIEIALNGTASQIRAVVRRYAETIGIEVVGVSDAVVGEEVLRHFKRSVKEGAMAKQRTDKFAELAAEIEAQLLLENDI